MADGCITPDAAVRAVPARLLLLCLLLRSSWLTVEGGRQIGAAGVLYRRGGGQLWPCRSAWLLAFQLRSSCRAGTDAWILTRMQESEGYGRRLGSAHARSAW